MIFAARELLRLWPIWLSLSCAALSAAEPPRAKVEFNRDIRPILSENCFKCHGPDEGARKARLRLDQRDTALAPAKSGKSAIVAGSPDQSELVARISTSDDDERMPPAKTGKRLTPAQMDLLRRWIAEGAPYARHWSYVKPARPALPAVRDPRWPINSVDRFVLARLESEKLEPSPEADRRALIRRASLALTGLPPTPAEVEAFVKDRRPNGFEIVVDCLLASKAFGEHWARLWLDLARYADSAGYADDPPRTIWAYRDYIIRSLNANKRFDRFTIEQIAGDLLDEASEEDLVATAFQRNTMTNNEGGTNDEEFRNAAVVDRVNTTMSVWMATSMGCAQCHTHKYDPITQREYFQFLAFFNNSADADRHDEAPVLKLWKPDQLAERKELLAEIAEAQQAAGLVPEKLDVDEDPPEPPKSSSTDTNKPAPPDPAADLKKKLTGIKANTVPIMRELAGDQRRLTHMQFRGNYLDLGDEVSAAVPAVFQALPQNMPTNRLALARWLVDPENPLTARVIVNRFWEQIFGIGLVRTSDDFGTQGDRPTHPELLDFLATEFVAQGWDIKALLKTMVTSATFRQSSRITPVDFERDPENLLLARGPRFRLGAEMVRDQALAVSGLLSPKMYGPSVRPPQPSLGLTAAFGSSLDWKTSEGEDRYRRALYIEWRRTNPYASMATFDAPNREVCALRRPRSNTPLQALVTLNDPVYFEAAQALAKRIAAVPGGPEKKISRGFEICLARPSNAAETKRLKALYHSAHAHFQGSSENARQMAGLNGATNEIVRPAAELAAWTAVANVLLNLDEFLMPP